MKKILRTLLAASLCVCMTTTLLAGCSSAPAESEAPPTTDAPASEATEPTDDTEGDGEVKEIELFSQKKENVEIYDAIIADFMAEHSDIKVVQTTTAGGTTFLARVASNDLPDIGGIYNLPDYHPMMEEGLFVDQSAEPYITKINDSVIEMTKFTDGKLYMLPITLNGFGLYINMDIYDEHGLEVPTTVEELIANAETLTAAGVNPFAFPYKEVGSLGQLFERFLGGAVDPEVWEINQAVADGATYQDYPEIVNYMEKWYEIAMLAQVDPLSTDSDNVHTMFANGEAAMIFNGTWGTSVVENLNPEMNYQVAVVPTVSGVEATTSGTVDIGLAISADGDNIDACKTFLEYFVEDAVAQKFAEGDKNPTAVKAVTYSNPNLAPVTEAIADGRFSSIPMTYQPAGFRTEIQVILQQLLLDGDVDAFLNSWNMLTDQFYNQQ